MKQKFTKGTKVIINGKGKKNGKTYSNELGRIIEYDVFYKDYNVVFSNGTDDWFIAKYLKKV